MWTVTQVWTYTCRQHCNRLKVLKAGCLLMAPSINCVNEITHSSEDWDRGDNLRWKERRTIVSLKVIDTRVYVILLDWDQVVITRCKWVHMKRICFYTGYHLYSQYIRLSEQLYSTTGLRFSYKQLAEMICCTLLARNFRNWPKDKVV